MRKYGLRYEQLKFKLQQMFWLRIKYRKAWKKHGEIQFQEIEVCEDLHNLLTGQIEQKPKEDEA
jgi:hypothetical protein